jgi:hypothetical protein
MVLIGFLILLTSAPLSSIATASAAPIIFVGNGANSTNWSGYAVTAAAGTITIAQGSWVVPPVTCATGETSYSAFWVGIDGFSSSTVEQTGTDSDCHNGVPTYYAWFEFFPQPSRGISTVPIHPGDVVNARVSYKPSILKSLPGTFTVTVNDVTTSKMFSTSSRVLGAQRSSAEFIAEAPALCGLTGCHLASLSNFGTAGFGPDNSVGSGISCAVAVNGALANIGTYGAALQEVTMVSQSNPSTVKAQPSAVSTDGTSFTIQWMNAGP